MRIMSMKRRMRKGISLALAAALTLSLAGSSLVMAAEPEDTEVTAMSVTASGTCGSSDSDDVTWCLTSDGTLTFSGSGAMEGYGDIDGTPWYSYKSQIESIVVESGVTSVGSCAFEFYFGMTPYIEDITIGDTVTEIEDYAFVNITSLETMTFEGDAPSIDSENFGDMTFTAYYPADNDTWTSDVMQDYDGSITWVSYGGDSSSDDSSSDDSAAEEITYTYSSGTLTISGSGAMEDFSSASAAPWYSYKDSITAVVIESGVTSIGAYAFTNYGSLASVTIADSVTSIGQAAFDYCSSLTSITIPEKVTSIGAYAFEGTGLKSVTIPDSVSEIGGRAFSTCTSLTDVTIGTGITSIGGFAFEACSALNTVTFSGNAPSFGTKVFFEDTLTVYYPSGNSTWTSDVMQQYGGTITWVAVTSTSGSSSSNNAGSSSTAKAAQKITVKKASLKKSFKASKLKKKKQTFKIKASAKGKLTYKKLSGSKNIKVSKAGKVTVKKGTKKKTYKVTVQIKAAATSAYAANTVKKTLKITVK